MAREVLDLVRAKATGVLEVRADSRAADVHFTRGMLTYVEGGVVADTIGRLLLREHAIAADDHETVIATMAKGGQRFGETAVALGFMTEAEVEAALERQVRRKVERCFGWHGASWKFVADAARVARAPRFPVRTPAVVLAGVRAHMPAALFDAVLEQMLPRAMELQAPADAVASAFDVGPEMRKVLELVDAQRTLSDVLQHVKTEPEEAKRFFVAMRLVGMIACLANPRERVATDASSAPPATDKRAMRPRAVTPAVMGPVVPGTNGAIATLAAARMRAIQLRAEAATAPETERGALIASANATVDAIRDIQAAVERPGRASQRHMDREVPADPMMATLEAESAYTNGKRLLHQASFAAAARDFEFARACMPDVDEYALYLEWARFSAGIGDAAGSKQELERLSIRLLRQDQNYAFAHYVQGHLARIAGDQRRAARAFHMAAMLDPSHLDAVRHARLFVKRESNR